ncbi:hypothetical protein GCM10027092_27950 [Yaniella soli]
MVSVVEIAVISVAVGAKVVAVRGLTVIVTNSVVMMIWKARLLNAIPLTCVPRIVLTGVGRPILTTTSLAENLIRASNANWAHLMSKTVLGSKNTW